MRRALCTLLLLLRHIREIEAERRIFNSPFRRATEDGGDIRRKTLTDTTKEPEHMTDTRTNVSGPLNTTGALIIRSMAPTNTTVLPKSIASGNETLLNATESPINTNVLPTNATEAAVNITVSTTNVTERAVNTTVVPTNATEATAKTTVISTNATEATAKATAAGEGNAATNATISRENAGATGKDATPAVANAWLAVSESSPCTVFTQDRYSCGRTGHFPKEYGKNETCKFKVLKAGQITARPFHTENKFDVLYIDNEQFSGAEGPRHVNVKVGANITWHSDASVVFPGFEFCLGQDLRNDGFLISASSSCELSTEKFGEKEHPCVQTRRYPKNYEDGQECFIRTEKEGYIYAVNFKTEANFDVLSIGEKAENLIFSGDTKPESAKVAARTKVRWKSDNRYSEPGWKICLSSTPMPTSAPSVAQEPKKSNVDSTATSASENTSLFSVTIVSSLVNDFVVSIRPLKNERIKVSCLLQHATQGVPASLFEKESEELKHVTVYPDMPEGSGVIKFTKTINGFPLSRSQYRLSCRGPDRKIGTSVIVLKNYTDSRATEQASGEHGSAPLSFFRNVLWFAFVVAIVACGARSVKKYRGQYSVTHIDYEMSSPRATRSGGYVPPTMVGYSGMV